MALTYDLHNAEHFRSAWAESLRHGGGLKNPATVAIDALYCPSCGERRRVDFTAIPHPHPFAERPQLAIMVCRQCHAESFGLGYDGPNGDDLVIVRRIEGGLATANTPKPVAYYLDQAARSEGNGARSAAISMYRAALEQFLFQQNYKEGMLGKKIKDLTDELDAGGGPEWAKRLDPEFLKVIQALGNGSIHPNGGDIGKQAALDDALIGEVRATFETLLDLAYEEPARSIARLAKLKGAAKIVDK